MGLRVAVVVLRVVPAGTIALIWTELHKMKAVYVHSSAFSRRHTFARPLPHPPSLGDVENDSVCCVNSFRISPPVLGTDKHEDRVEQVCYSRKEVGLASRLMPQ